MSIFQLIKEAHRADLHNNTEKVVLSIITDSIGEHGECWIDKRTLAEWAHRSESAIWRATSNLQKAGRIVVVPLFRPYWSGAQAGNGYILTAVADTPEKIETAKSVLLARRWRDGALRDNAMGGGAISRPLEVSPRSGPSNPDGEIGESGYAAPFPEGGEDEPQQQQPTDVTPDVPPNTTIAADTTTTDPTDPPVQHDAVTYAWIDAFGELTDKQYKYLSNAVAGNSADEVLRALALAKRKLEKGEEIAAPAAYVKKILTNRTNEYGAGHRTAPQSPAAGHRNQVDWSAVAEETSQADPDEMRQQLIDMGLVQQAIDTERDEAKKRQEQDRAAWQQREVERKEQERIAAERAQIEKQLQRERDAALYAERQRRDVAGVIANATGADDDTALRMADDFLRATPDAWWQEKLLDALRQKRALSGKPLTTQQATAILHRALLDTTPAPARVTA